MSRPGKDDPLPLYAPRRPLPAEAWRPGLPHPRSDPRRLGRPAVPEAPFDGARWRGSEDYLHGIDLFNRGFYWEAHEAWEVLWLACPREGAAWNFLKGLIQLTASRWKASIGHPGGGVTLARFAAVQFERVRRETGMAVFGGLALEGLRARAERMAAGRADRDPLLP